jgi:multicomponent Na+:H+ antiporter subunit F
MAARLGLFILVAGMLLIAYRIVRGPRSADRIISLDLLSVLVVALLVLYSIYSGEKAYLDVAIAYALVAFLGTVAFARFVERSSPGSHFPPEESREENKRE